MADIKQELEAIIDWDTVKRKVKEQATIYSPKKKEIALSKIERQNMKETALKKKIAVVL
jgi:hypothetical protein